MLREVVAALRCPVCETPLSDGGGTLRCASGHAFDVARQGYVSFLTGKPSGLLGDDAAMVDARARFLGAGHFEPLARELVAACGGAAEGLVVEVGAGTGWYLGRVLDAQPERSGLAIDLSRFAARRAARAHPRAAAAVADASRRLPLADGCAGLALDIFAPRNGAELRRIVRDDGLLAVVTPTPEHLAELRGPLGLIDVDPEKGARVEAALAPFFERRSSAPVRWAMTLGRADVLNLAAMGPSARHAGAATLAERAAGLPDAVAVLGSCLLERWTPRSNPGARPPSGSRAVR